LLPYAKLLPRVSEELVRLCAWMPFARAKEISAGLGIVRVSPSTARRQALSGGAALVLAETEAAEWIIAEAPEPTSRAVAHQLLSVDGAMVPLTGGEWAEVKTIAIGTVRTGGEGASRTTDLSYFSRLADHTTFTRQATLETYRRATDRAGRVTAVTDGAEWIQECLDVQCARAARIIDWGHASSYVAEAARAIFSDEAEQVGWRQSQLQELLHGSPQAVIVELCRQLAALPLETEAAAGVSKSLAYLARRFDQIQYAAFLAAGLPIGSGIVESANKLVVEARLKGAGMHWARANVDPMLALRNAECSDRWAETWSTVHLYRCAQARERTRLRHDARRAQLEPVPSPPKPRKHRSWRNFRLRGSPPPRRAKL
jgi:hypothetical protein